MDPSKWTSCSKQCFFTQVYRIILHRPVAPGGPERSQEPAHMLLCKQTVKAWQRSCNCAWGQLQKSGTGGGRSSDASCLLLLRDCGGTAGPRHPPPHGNIPLAPLGFFSPELFFPVNSVLLKSCSIWTPREWKPLTGSKEMVLATPGGVPAGPSLQLLFADWWWSGGTFSAH